jgi:hypothetical protein
MGVYVSANTRDGDTRKSSPLKTNTQVSDPADRIETLMCLLAEVKGMFSVFRYLLGTPGLEPPMLNSAFGRHRRQLIHQMLDSAGIDGIHEALSEYFLPSNPRDLSPCSHDRARA